MKIKYVIGQKIENFINSVEKSRYAFCKKTGIRDNTMGRIIEVGDLKLSQIYQIVEKYPNFWKALEPDGITKTDYKEPGENGILNEPQQEYQKTQKTQQYKIENEGLINESDLHSQIADLKKQLAKKDEIILMLSTAIANVTKEDEVGERGYDNSDLKEIANEKLIRIAELKKEKGIE